MYLANRRYQISPVQIFSINPVYPVVVWTSMPLFFSIMFVMAIYMLHVIFINALAPMQSFPSSQWNAFWIKLFHCNSYIFPTEYHSFDLKISVHFLISYIGTTAAKFFFYDIRNVPFGTPSSCG